MRGQQLTVVVAEDGDGDVGEDVVPEVLVVPIGMVLIMINMKMTLAPLLNTVTDHLI